MRLLPNLLRGGGRFVDVGANRGVYAYVAASLCQHVELFEPNPLCATILYSFAERRSNICVHNVALSDQHGSAVLQVPVDAAGVEHDSSASIEKISAGPCREYCVQLATLDSYRFHSVKLIKIDVEGHESRVLDGAVQTISSQMPALLIEIEQRHLKCTIEDIFWKIHSFGYEGFFLDANDELRPLSEFDSGYHQAITSLGGRRGFYINNFIFLHRARLTAGEYYPIVLKN